MDVMFAFASSPIHPSGPRTQDRSNGRRISHITTQPNSLSHEAGRPFRVGPTTCT